jgi:hypothetical protein
MRTHRISIFTSGILVVSSIGATLLHGQGLSLGEAARRAREQKQGQQPSKVITNEDIADLKGTVSVVGTTPPAPTTTETAPAEDATKPEAAPEEPVKDEAYWRAKFTEVRKKLADDSKELDILQREYNLKEQQFYSNPNVALREQYGRADLNKTRDDINAKKADVEKDQQAIAAMEDALRKAGGNPGWAREQ